jgi:vitamin B12 transporter
MKFSPLALSIALAPTLAQATPDTYQLGETVITANRSAQARSDTPVATTVFTRADIERLQPNSVLDLIARAPGVQVTQSGGRGSLSSLFIRGTKTAQNVVLVDGQRIADVSSGSPFLELLDVGQIERVEILRGPRATLYGSDAIGGVVQIFTRRAARGERRARVQLGYGSNQTWERSLGTSYGDQDTRFNLTATSQETAGFDRTTTLVAGADDDRDAFRNHGLGLNASQRLHDQVQVGLSALYQKTEAEFDNDSTGAYPYSRSELSSVSLFADTQPTADWNSRVEAGHSENRYETRADDTDNLRYNYSYRDSVSWLNNLALTDRHSVLLGADWLEERLSSNNAYVTTERWNYGLIAQHQYHGERVSTELGFRHDKNRQFNTHNTFNAAATLHVDADNDIVLSYAEGFRAPSFQDIYAPAGWGANPDLKPEESRSIELQWRSQLSADTRLEAALFQTRISQAIVSDENWVMQNLDSATVRGFEASVQHQMGNWSTSANLAVIDPRDDKTDNQLNRRAKRTLSLDIDRQWGTYSLGAGWQGVSSSYDDAANTRKLAGYGLLGLRASWQATPELQVSAKVDNLLDKTYARAQYSHGWPASYADYREEGRTALLSVTWTPAF